MCPARTAEQSPLASCHDHEIAFLAILFETSDRSGIDDKLTAATLELLHPGRHLQALVHRSGRPLEPSGPPVEQCRGFRRCEGGHAHPSDLGAFLVPEAQSEGTLDPVGHVEHALTRRHPAVSDLIRGAVRDDRDCIAVLEQSDAQRQSSLSGADDGDSPSKRIVSHVAHSFCVCVPAKQGLVEYELQVDACRRSEDRTAAVPFRRNRNALPRTADINWLCQLLARLFINSWHCQ